jgi:hypothetical protein
VTLTLEASHASEVIEQATPEIFCTHAGFSTFQRLGFLGQGHHLRNPTHPFGSG